MSNKERINFHDAQFLDTEDLDQEQLYTNTKIERLADNLTGTGTIEFEGLDILPDPILASPIIRTIGKDGLGFTDFPQLQSDGRTRFSSSQIYQVFKAHSNNIQRIDLRVNLISADSTETSSLLVQIRDLVIPTSSTSAIGNNILFERVIPKSELPLLSDTEDNSLLTIDVSDTSDQKGVVLEKDKYYALYLGFPADSITTDILRTYRSFNTAITSNTNLHSNILDSTDTSLNHTLSTWFYNNDAQQFEQGIRTEGGTLQPYTIFHTIWTSAVKVNQGTAYIDDGKPIIVSDDDHRFVSILSDGTANHVLIKYTQDAIGEVVQPRTGVQISEFLEDSSTVVAISDASFQEIKNEALDGVVDPATNKEYPLMFEYPKDSGVFYFELARVTDKNTVSLNRSISIDLSDVTNLVYKDWRFPSNSIPSARANQIASQNPNDLVFYVDNVPVNIPRTIEVELSRDVSPGDSAIYVYPTGEFEPLLLGDAILHRTATNAPTATFEFGEITTYTNIASVNDSDNDGYGDETKIYGIPATGDNAILIYYTKGTRVIVQRSEELEENTTPSHDEINNVTLQMKMNENNTREFQMNSVREVTVGRDIDPNTGQEDVVRSFAVILTADEADISPNANVNTFVFDKEQLTPNTFYNFMAFTNTAKKIYYQDYDRPAFTFTSEDRTQQNIRERRFTFDMAVGQRIITLPENLILGVNSGAMTEYEPRFDVNEDGSIDEKEIIGLEATFGKYLGQDGFDARYDFNNNNIVDDNDRYELEQRFGAVQGFTAATGDGYGGVSRDLHRLESIIVYEQNNTLNKSGVANAASKATETIIYLNEAVETAGTYVLEFGFSDILSPVQNQFILLTDTSLEDTITDLSTISLVGPNLTEVDTQIIKLESVFDDDEQKYENTFTVAPGFTTSGDYLVTTNWDETHLANVNRKIRAITSGYEYDVRRKFGPYKVKFDSSDIDVTGESLKLKFDELDSCWADGTFDNTLQYTTGESIRDMQFDAFLFVENPVDPDNPADKPTTSVWTWQNIEATLEGNIANIELEFNDNLFLSHKSQGKKPIGKATNAILAQPFGLSETQVTLKPEFAGGDIKNDLSNLIIVRADYSDQFVKVHQHLSTSDGGTLNSSQIQFDDPEGRYDISGSVTDIIYFLGQLTRLITNENISSDAGIEARKLNFEETNFANMLQNGSFEQWPMGINYNPDGTTDSTDSLPFPWVRSSVDINIRPSKFVRYEEEDAQLPLQDPNRNLGLNAIKLTDDSSTKGALYQRLTIGEELQERWVTASGFGLTYKSESHLSGAHVYIKCYDATGAIVQISGANEQVSNIHSGLQRSVGTTFEYAWELLQVSVQIPRRTRVVEIGLRSKLTPTVNAVAAFFDSVSLVLGRLAPGYAPVGNHERLELMAVSQLMDKASEWTTGFNNLVKNGNFEGWDSLATIADEWTESGTFIQDTTLANRKYGIYSGKLSGSSSIEQSIDFTLFEKDPLWKERSGTNNSEEPDYPWAKDAVRRIYLTFSAWIKTTDFQSSEQDFYDALNTSCYLQITTTAGATGTIENALGFDDFADVSPLTDIPSNESRRTGSFTVDPNTDEVDLNPLDGYGPTYRRRDLFDEKGFEKLTLTVCYKGTITTDFADEQGFKVRVVNDGSTDVYVDNTIAVEGRIVPIYAPSPISDQGKSQKLYGSIEIHNSETGSGEPSLKIAEYSASGIVVGVEMEDLTSTGGAANGIKMDSITSTGGNSDAAGIFATEVKSDGSGAAYGVDMVTVLGDTASGTGEARGLRIGSILGGTSSGHTYGIDITTITSKGGSNAFGGLFSAIGADGTGIARGLHFVDIHATEGSVFGIDMDTVDSLGSGDISVGLNVDQVTASTTDGSAYGVRLGSGSQIKANTSYGAAIEHIGGDGTSVDDGYGTYIKTVKSNTSTGNSYGIHVEDIGSVNAYGYSAYAIGNTNAINAYGQYIDVVKAKTTSGGSAYGIRVGATANSIVAETSYGIHVYRIGSAGSATSYGLKIETVDGDTSAGVAYGAYINDVDAREVTGLYIDDIDGGIRAYGIRTKNISGSSGSTYGIEIDTVGNTSGTSYGQSISNITADSNDAIGLQISAIVGDGAYGISVSNIDENGFSGGEDVYGTSVTTIGATASGAIYGNHIKTIGNTNAINAYGQYIDVVKAKTTSGGSAYGIRVGATANSIVAETSYGIHVYRIGSAGSATSYGLKIETVDGDTSAGVAYGAYINDVDAREVTGLYIDDIDGGIRAYGIRTKNISGSSGSTYGIEIDTVGNTSGTSYGQSISNITADSNDAIGLQISAIVGDGAYGISVSNIDENGFSGGEDVYGTSVTTIGATASGAIYGNHIKTIGNTNAINAYGQYIETVLADDSYGIYVKDVKTRSVTAALVATGIYVEDVGSNGLVSGSDAHGVYIKTVTTSSGVLTDAAYGLRIEDIHSDSSAYGVYIEEFSVTESYYGVYVNGQGSTPSKDSFGFYATDLSATTADIYGYYAQYIMSFGNESIGIGLNDIGWDTNPVSGSNFGDNSFGIKIETVDAGSNSVSTIAHGVFINNIGVNFARQARGISVTNVGDNAYTGNIYGQYIDLVKADLSSSSGKAYGIYIGATANSILADTSVGVSLNNVGSGSGVTNGIGLEVSTIKSGENAYGANIQTVGASSALGAYGTYIKTIGSTGAAIGAYGTYIDDVQADTTSGKAYGIYIGNDIQGQSSESYYIYCGTSSVPDFYVTSQAKGGSNEGTGYFKTNLGIGTFATGTLRLHVAGNVKFDAQIIASNLSSAAPGTNLITDGTYILLDSSALRFKKNIVNIGEEVDTSKLYNLRPVLFDWKEKMDYSHLQRDVGLIAEEVEKEFPNLVTYNKKKELQSVRYDRLTVLLLSEMKNLKAENNELKSLIENLSLRVKALES